jgi:hypothetical protein
VAACLVAAAPIPAALNTSQEMLSPYHQPHSQRAGASHRHPRPQMLDESCFFQTEFQSHLAAYPPFTVGGEISRNFQFVPIKPQEMRKHQEIQLFERCDGDPLPWTESLLEKFEYGWGRFFDGDLRTGFDFDNGGVNYFFESNEIAFDFHAHFRLWLSGCRATI